MGPMGAVEAAATATVIEVGEISKGSFLENAFFSLARLFWNHTFTWEKRVEGRCVSAVERWKKWGVKRVPGPPWETS